MGRFGSNPPVRIAVVWTAAIDATSRLATVATKDRNPPTAEIQMSTLPFLKLDAGKPAPLPLGESGASSVTRGSKRRAALLACP
jgi:hypothetical protein